jgi:hypothetical protein
VGSSLVPLVAYGVEFGFEDAVALACPLFESGPQNRLPVRVAETGASARQLGVTVVPGATNATIDPAGSWLLADLTAEARPGDAVLASSAAAPSNAAVGVCWCKTRSPRGRRTCRRMQSPPAAPMLSFR